MLAGIGAKHGKTVAQIALRWLVQQPDIVVVPRALALHEIEEDIDLFDFDLSAEDMDRIGVLGAMNLRIIDS